jgi:hypothetical protein
MGSVIVPIRVLGQAAIYKAAEIVGVIRVAVARPSTP